MKTKKMFFLFCLKRDQKFDKILVLQHLLGSNCCAGNDHITYTHSMIHREALVVKKIAQEHAVKNFLFCFSFCLAADLRQNTIC